MSRCSLFNNSTLRVDDAGVWKVSLQLEVRLPSSADNGYQYGLVINHNDGDPVPISPILTSTGVQDQGGLVRPLFQSGNLQVTLAAGDLLNIAGRHSFGSLGGANIFTDPGTGNIQVERLSFII